MDVDIDGEMVYYYEKIQEWHQSGRVFKIRSQLQKALY